MDAHRRSHRGRRRLALAGAAGAAAITLGITPLMAGPSAQASTAAPGPSVKPASSRCPAPGGAKIAEAAAPKGEIKVYGHGWGHGMGMSQYGAQGAAKLGCSYRTILHTYYQGTSVAKQALSAPVQLTLAQNSTSSTLKAETGRVTWTGFGSATATQPSGSTWTVRLQSDDGTAGLALADGDGKQRLFVHKGVPITAAHSGKVVTVDPSSAGPLRTRYDQARFVRTADKLGVTELITASGGRTAVQKYLSGLAEVPVSWPSEALKAQVVAARTYLAAKYNSTLKAYKLSTTTSDQVYQGFTREADDFRLGNRWRSAVDATAGQVILDSSKRPIEAMYSSSMGGFTENRQFVYGNYGISYLKAVDDSRWDAASDNTSYRSWSKGFSKASFAEKFGFDAVRTYSIGKRGSTARVEAGVKITGTIDGHVVTKEFTGSAAKYRLGLRSTGFTFS